MTNHAYFQTHIFSRIATIAALAMCVIAIAPIASSQATPGRFDVTLTSTAKGPWSSVSGGTGRYTSSTNSVSARSGLSKRGSSREWRVTAPSSLRISDGKVAIRWSLPRPEFRATVRSGNNGGAVRSLASLRTGSSAIVDVPGDQTWVAFGLSAISDARPSTTGANAASLSSLRLTLWDPAAPSWSRVSIPGTDGWLGAACRGWQITAYDGGSGISSIAMLRGTSGPAIAQRTFASGRALQPGDTTGTASGCLSAHDLGNGRVPLRVLTYDASGRSAARDLVVKSDTGPPQIDGLPQADTVFTTPQPTIAVSAADAVSGVATVSAAVDGAPAQMHRTGDQWRVAFAQPLPPGRHVIDVAAVDRAGNRRSERRAILIRDVTPPTINLSSPGASGGTIARIVGTAHDGGSGVVPSSWSMSVDGQAVDVAMNAGTAQGRSSVLTPGQHAIAVSVSDTAGNTATVRRTYTVVPGADGSSTARVGGQNGVFITSWPARPVPRGSKARVAVVAAANGRPLAYQQIQARMGGRTIGRAVTNAHGIARVDVRATQPGSIRLVATGASVPSRSKRLKVAPRVTLGRVRRSVRVGTPVRIAGRVRANRQVRMATVQARSGATWYTVKRRVRIQSNGRFSVSIRSAAPGAIRIRIRVAGQRGWSAAVSRARVLRSKR